jgi:hypothetical protein
MDWPGALAPMLNGYLTGFGLPKGMLLHAPKGAQIWRAQ